MFILNKTYFISAVLLLVAELIIGLYVHDTFIRPFGGDFLVVIMVYCFVKSFFSFDIKRTLIGVLLFAYIVELCQAFHLIDLLQLQHSSVARMLLGTSFAWADMLMYTLGILLVWLTEKLLKRI